MSSRSVLASLQRLLKRWGARGTSKPERFYSHQPHASVLRPEHREAVEEQISRWSRGWPRPHEWLPGFTGINERGLTLLKRLWNNLQPLKRFDGEFDGLFTVAGGRSYPLGTPSGELKPRQPTERQLGLFLMVARAWFEQWEPASVPIKRISNSGAPWYNWDLRQHATDIARVISSASEIEPLLEAGDWVALYKKFNLINAHHLTRRLQVDPPGVEGGRLVSTRRRDIHDWMGRRVVQMNVRDTPDGPRSNMRVRIAYGAARTPNAILQLYFNGFRKCALDRMPLRQILHFTGPEDIQMALGDSEAVLAIDVVQFDQNHPVEFLMGFLASAPSPTAQMMALDQIRGPVLAPCDYPPGHPWYVKMGYVWIGNPMDPNTWTHYFGLPSGVAWGDMFVKTAGIGFAMAIADEAGFKGEWLLYGEHSDELRLLNAGDNIIFAGTQKRIDAVKEALASPNLPYEARPEDVPTFLGYELARTQAGWSVTPSRKRYFDKVYVPERSIRARPHWKFGRAAAVDFYSQEPSFWRLREVEWKVLRQSGLDPLGLEDRVQPLGMEVDPVLAMDSDRILWDPRYAAVTIAQLPPQLREEFLALPPEWATIVHQAI